jgi:hypothetical protein
VKEIVATICNDIGTTEFGFGRFECGKRRDAPN